MSSISTKGGHKQTGKLYYQTTQGSAVLDYNVFLNLEVAGGQDLFRSDANSERYGLTPQAPNPRTNPDGLPIGLAKTVVAEGPFTGQEMVGPTCALCHNTQLYYKGKTVRIDGGVGNHLDFMAYIYALDAALQETLNDPAKFDRLAARVGATSADTKSDLRKRIEPQAQDVHFYSTRVVVAPYPWGPSRMDAISLIVNRLTSVLPQIPENWSTPIAPTKPPFLWNAPQGSWTQWRAVQQDPIKRNLTETMGVFMPIDLVSKTPEEGLFSSNAMLLNLETIEGMLVAPCTPEMAGRSIRQDRPRKGQRGRGGFRPVLRELVTIPTPTPGRRRTSTASASSKSAWCRNPMLGPIPDSSATCGRTP